MLIAGGFGAFLRLHPVGLDHDTTIVARYLMIESVLVLGISSKGTYLTARQGLCRVTYV